ncbi:hypothetical protein [Labrenzia sp. VG12]|nr:hypothetical protein [Labrenzia sp. VG12]
MAKLSLPVQVLLIAASFALLLLAALATDAFVPIRFGFASAMG